MSAEELLLIVLKSAAVGCLLGAIAHKMKHRSFLLWAAIGAAASAIFPGLSLLALIVLGFLPARRNNGQEKR